MSRFARRRRFRLRRCPPTTALSDMHARNTSHLAPRHAHRAPVSRPHTTPRDAPRQSRTHLRARHARTRRRRCVRAPPRARFTASPTRARVEVAHLVVGPRSEARHPRRMACRMSMSPSNLCASAGHKFGVGGPEIEVIRDAAVGGVDRRELASWVKDGGVTVAAVIRGQLLPPQGPACRHRRPLGLGSQHSG